MDLSPYLRSVAEDLDKVTALAEPTTQETARRLATALEPALRLALVSAVTDAAAEIGAQLGEGAVTVHLRDGEPVLSAIALGSPAPVPPAPSDGGRDDEGDGRDEPQDEAQSRLTVRLPESLKRRVEDRAARADVSVNTWITQALRRAVSRDDEPRPRSARRVSGWA